MNQRHHGKQQNERGQRHRRVTAGGRAQHSIPLTSEGFPAATAEAPKTSPTVLVSKESLARYPWLPARVIAGSIWRGPKHERVRVDDAGNAAP